MKSREHPLDVIPRDAGLALVEIVLLFEPDDIAFNAAVRGDFPAQALDLRLEAAVFRGETFVLIAEFADSLQEPSDGILQPV
ncbi:MAG: hypothetical protein ACKVU1_11210 [bacterium]